MPRSLTVLLVIFLSIVCPNGRAQMPVLSATAADEHAFTDWARRNAIPLKTTTPVDDMSDMIRLDDLVGDTRIVELGEATHGTSEFSQVKDRMVRYLATQKGFTIFSIEANMPEAYRLNNYVLNGIGEPKALLKGMYFWTWNTREVLDMILWMREYNLSGKGRLQFTGFDMQIPTLSLENVRQFVAKYDLPYVLELSEAYKDVARSNPQESRKLQLCRSVMEDLEARRNAYLKAGASAGEIEWAIQNARLVAQFEEMKTGGAAARDRSMAENIEWIANQNPGAKIIVWAHNGHVSYQPYGRTPSMGGYLKRYFGPQIVNFGFVLDQGSFRAFDSEQKKVSIFTVGPAPEGTWDEALSATRIPLFALDLRRATSASETAAWLQEQHRTRSIGAVYSEDDTDNYWHEAQLQKEFDAVFFIEKTTASHGLP